MTSIRAKLVGSVRPFVNCALLGKASFAKTCCLDCLLSTLLPLPTIKACLKSRTRKQIANMDVTIVIAAIIHTKEKIPSSRSLCCEVLLKQWQPSLFRTLEGKPIKRSYCYLMFKLGPWSCRRGPSLKQRSPGPLQTCTTSGRNLNHGPDWTKLFSF